MWHSKSTVKHLLHVCLCPDRYGRRWVHCVCMVVATLPLLLCVPLVAGSSPHTDTAVIALAVTSKVASNVGWFIMWVQAMEVTPPPSPVASC